MLKKMFSYLIMLSMVSFQLVFAGSQFSFAHAQETPQDDPETPYLIISAVQITGGTGHTQEDFIELYNPTDSPFDLSGHRLVKRTATATTDSLIKSWSEAAVVPAHHFYLWANSSYSSLPVPADSTGTATIADNNGIALRQGNSDSGVIIDDIAWGNTANGFNSVSQTNPGGNESLIRTDVFEADGVFEIGPSAPRNSSTELLPEPADPPADDPPADDPPADDPPADDPPADDPPSDGPPPTIEPLNLKITELYPNPSGSDSGHEQVEIYNAGNSVANLEGLKLDDVSAEDELSSNAYTLSTGELEPDTYLAITIPTGKFAMNNTSGDVVTLFDSENEALFTVVYTSSTPEAKSYSLFDEEDEWQWSEPSLGEENGEMSQNAGDDNNDDDEDSDEEVVDYGDYDNGGLQINEIYSTPTEGSTEYIELYNAGEEPAQLAVAMLVVGERRKLLPEFELKPDHYYVVEQNYLPVQLRNSGQDLKLMEDSKVLDSVSYPALVAGTSYARFEDGFLLTLKPTKGVSNVLQIPDEVKKVAAEAATKTTAKTTKKTAATKASTKTATKSNSTSEKDIKESTKPEANDQSKTEPEATVKPSNNNKESMGKIIAMGAAAVTAGMVALYKLVFSTGAQ